MLDQKRMQRGGGESVWLAVAHEPGHGGLKNYVVLKGVEIGFLYSGEECVLSEVEVVVEGSAGGLYDNATEAITFSNASLTSTGTELTAFGSKVEWNAVFGAAAFGPHLGEALTVS
jgi:hypothetical protein